MKLLSKLKTNHQVIEYVRDNLIKQGKQSRSVYNGNCKYRGGEDYDLKCAIGWLIDDEWYQASFEDKKVTDRRVFSAVEKSVPNWKIDMDLLQQFQHIHDHFEPNQWEWQFSRLMVRY